MTTNNQACKRDGRSLHIAASGMGIVNEWPEKGERPMIESERDRQRQKQRQREGASRDRKWWGGETYYTRKPSMLAQTHHSSAC